MTGGSDRLSGPSHRDRNVPIIDLMVGRRATRRTEFVSHARQDRCSCLVLRGLHQTTLRAANQVVTTRLVGPDGPAEEPEADRP